MPRERGAFNPGRIVAHARKRAELAQVDAPVLRKIAAGEMTWREFLFDRYDLLILFPCWWSQYNRAVPTELGELQERLDSWRFARGRCA